MNQEFATIEVTPVGSGVYRVFSLYEKESVALTAQALVELSIWIAKNKETLEREAQQEGAERPGVSMLISNLGVADHTVVNFLPNTKVTSAGITQSVLNQATGITIPVTTH